MLEHYHKSERSFVRKVMDHKKKCEETGDNLITKFLSPREVDIYKEIFGKKQAIIKFGGYENCERNRIIIHNNKNKKVQFNVTAIQVSYNKKFGKIDHKNIFGSLMRLGLERENFGDVYMGDKIFIFLCSEIADFIIQNISKINKCSVELKIVDPSTINIENVEQFKERLYFLKSFRLDLLVAHVCIYPRSEVTDMIKKGLIKVNHKIIEKDSFEVKVGDIVSVRGYGRMKLLEEFGTTRNERIKVNIGKVV